MANLSKRDVLERRLDRNGACEHDLTGRLRQLIASALPSPLAHAPDLTCHLSQREGVIFRLLGVGYDNRSIARQLSLSEYTVKRHITRILAKLELTSRLQAGLVALVMSWPLRNSCWHLGGMDDSKSAAYAYRAEITEEEVTWMTIEERAISVARGGLPG